MRSWVAGFVVLSGLSLAADSPAEASREATGSVEALSAHVEIERTLLEEALQRYEVLSRLRRETIAALTQSYTTADTEVQKHGEDSAIRIEQLSELIQRAESDLVEQMATGHEVLRDIRGQLRRITLIEQQVAELLSQPEEQEAGMLSGSWDLVLLPLEQRGSAVLHQTGALVSGTYRLEGGYTGSLQGTLVGQKVFLVRIDSRLGKLMEFEGFLSSDGKRIRGSWLNYELAGAEGSTGQWSAQRRTDKP